MGDSYDMKMHKLQQRTDSLLDRVEKAEAALSRQIDATEIDHLTCIGLEERTEKAESSLRALQVADARRTITIWELIDLAECIEPGNEMCCPSGSDCPRCELINMVPNDVILAAQKLLGDSE